MRWIAVVALVACGGPDGGTPLAKTNPGSENSSGSGVVWVDANGDEVPGIVQFNQLSYVDGDGNVWALDPWGMKPEEAFGTGDTPAILYSSSDCSTDPWITSDIPAPRVVVSIPLHDRRAGTSGTNVSPDLSGPFFIVKDDERIDSQADAYGSWSGGCTPAGVLTGIPVSKLVQVDRPTIPWLPPVHPEFR